MFCTGWEHGVATLDPALGGGLCSAVTGTPTSAAAANRSGTYGLLLNPSGAGEAIRYNTATTGIRKVSARVYVKFVTSLPTTDVDLFSFNDVTPAQIAWVDFRQSDSRIIIQMNGGTATAIGPNPVTTGVWYRIDAQCDSSTTTGVIRGMVDGGTEGTATLGGFTAKDQRQWHLGNVAACTMTLHMDDFIFGTYTVDSEYWGAGQVVGISPNADGAHDAAIPANSLELASGTDITTSTTTVNTQLNSVPIGDGTVYVLSNGTSTAKYAEVAFADLPAGAARVNGARAMLAYLSVSTTGNNGETQIKRGDTSTVVVELGSTVTTTDINQPGTIGTPWDMSENPAVFYKGCMVPATAAGTDFGSLTVPMVNAILGRVGNSTDATPDPRWVDLMVEVDYVVASLSAARRDNPAMAVRDYDPWTTMGWLT